MVSSVQLLLKVTCSGVKNIDICADSPGGGKSIMKEKDADKIQKEIEAEAEEVKTGDTEQYDLVLDNVPIT